MQDPLRQNMLARMGIQCWQLRRPALLGTAPDHNDPVTVAIPTGKGSWPDGKLWLLAPQLPAQPLLGDLCQLLGIAPDEVTLLKALPTTAMPATDQSPLLWLTQADPRWPDALICPLTPSAAQKRALWQQLRQHGVTPA